LARANKRGGIAAMRRNWSQRLLRRESDRPIIASIVSRNCGRERERLESPAERNKYRVLDSINEPLLLIAKLPGDRWSAWSGLLLLHGGLRDISTALRRIPASPPENTAWPAVALPPRLPL